MKATIGLPFYNNEETLADAIRSVFAQSFQDWELILLNDGSQDRSLEIAESVDDPRVRVINDATNKGLPTRLNQITALARGQYLVRMDADDMMHPHRLEAQISRLNQEPEVDVVGSAMYSVDENDVIQGVRGNHPLRTTPYATLANGILVHVTAIARPDWFAKHPYDESLRRAQDRDLWCRAHLDSTFSLVSQPLMYVRETAADRVINNYLRGYRSERALFRKYGPHFIGKAWTRQLVAKSYIKSAAYKLAHLFQMHHPLIKRRNTPLLADEREAASQGMLQIRSTQVPGLTTPTQSNTNLGHNRSAA